MDLKTFSDELDYLSKSEGEMFHDFIISEEEEVGTINLPEQKLIYQKNRVEAQPKDLALDKIVTISQETKDGEVKEYQFKVSEIWSTPENFFSLISINEVKDDVNIWTLFYVRNKSTWYMKKANKGIVNVHVSV